MSYLYGSNAEVLYAMPAPVTKNTYTTQAVISALTGAQRAKVDPNFWLSRGPGAALMLQARGSIANTAAATFQMVLGWDPTAGTLGTTLATPWPTLAPTAAITSVWELDVLITASSIGAAGLTLQCNGEYRQSVVASGTLSTAPQSVKFRSNTTGLNSEAQAFLELWGTWSVSNAANTTTVDQMLLYGLN